MMSPLITKQLKMFQQQLDELAELNSQLKSDELFTVWFLRAYLTSDDGSAKSALTARRGEKGTDAVFIDGRARVAFMVQTKFRQRRFMKAESRSEVMAFAGLPQHLLDDDPKGFADFLKKMPPSAAERMREARRVVQKNDHRLHLVYATLGSCSKTVLTDAKRAARNPKKNTGFEVLDGRRLLLLLKDYLDGAAPPIPTLDLPIERSPEIDVNGVLQRYDRQNKLESWVVSIRGDEISELFEIGGPRLFARNVRGFLGDNTPINQSMQATLTREPDYFFYYNNGITIICDDAELVSHEGRDRMRVSNPQVINGQQTTRMLAGEGTRGSRASVLVKVIKVPRGVDGDQNQFDMLISNIVQATNWQNAIKPSDLMANDRRQVELEKALRKHGYAYLRKRQTKAEARKQAGPMRLPTLTKEELAQAVAGCDLDPVIARSGKDNLFTEEHYKNVFPTTNPLYYLPRYTLAKAVTSGARGYPQRGYMKWLVLGFLWRRLSASVRAPRSAASFTSLWAKQQPNLVRPLSTSVNLVYKAAARYYRANRGSGETVIDVSLFFRSKRGRNREFETFWSGLPTEFRKQMIRSVERVTDAITEDDE